MFLESSVLLKCKRCVELCNLLIYMNFTVDIIVMFLISNRK